MAKKPFFRNQGTAWATGAVLVVAGMWCLHDAFARRGSEAPFLVKLFTPGM